MAPFLLTIEVAKTGDNFRKIEGAKRNRPTQNLESIEAIIKMQEKGEIPHEKGLQMIRAEIELLFN
jgi:hypothetical protein